MKTVIYEYAGMIVSFVSIAGFFSVISALFFGETGFFASLISMVVGGA